jgi:hypothetical protein
MRKIMMIEKKMSECGRWRRRKVMREIEEHIWKKEI